MKKEDCKKPTPFSTLAALASLGILVYGSVLSQGQGGGGETEAPKQKRSSKVFQGLPRRQLPITTQD